jgi:HEAT repeat protein
MAAAVRLAAETGAATAAPPLEAPPSTPAAATGLTPPDGLDVPGGDGARGSDLQLELHALVGTLRGGEAAGRRRAAQALGECGPAAREAVAPLIEALSDADYWVSEMAAVALRKITGAPNPESDRRRRGSREPGSPPPAVEKLLAAIQDPGSRWMAVVALGELGPAARDAVPALAEALEDRELSVRWDAAKALGKIGAAAARAVPALTAVLHEQDDAIVRQRAVVALGEIGPAARAAVPALIGVLKESAQHLDEHAGEALVRIGSAAVPALIEATKDGDPRVRGMAASSLTRIATRSHPSLPPA